MSAGHGLQYLRKKISKRDPLLPGNYYKILRLPAQPHTLRKGTQITLQPLLRTG